MSSPNNIVLGNDEFSTFLGPVPPGAPNFSEIDFTATDPSHPGTVALGEPLGAPLSLAGHPSLVWALPSLVAHGKPGHEVYGSVTLEAPDSGTVDLQQGVNLSYGKLGLSTNEVGEAFTLNGASTVTNDSTLTALGGRYASIGLGNYAFNVNGSLSVTNNSVADFDRVQLAGTGTIHVGSGSIVDAKTIVAGLHVNVDYGGLLLLAQPNAAGIINEAAGGIVSIAGAASATHEIFHQASGVLDLLNKSGAQVASLKFAPGSHEYAKQTSGGLMEITVGSAHALPTTFTH